MERAIWREHAYACWLCSLPGVGNRTITALLAHFGTPERVYGAEEEELQKFLKASQLETFLERRGKAEPEREYADLTERGIGFVMQEDADYPKRLKNIPDAPYGLFFMGRLPREKLSVAVIGARDCSEYGRYVASELGRTLAEYGVSVISGMARGIDGISQEAALKAGGVSYGVLGCGVDICYPRQNRELYENLLREGGILSVFAPGMPARPQNFPPRNRIVSGLADVVVVIEARQKSGTLITVDMALEQGKEVYVVPGRVTDRLSDGCNKLLKQGAGVFLSPEDFLRDLEMMGKRNQGDCMRIEENTLKLSSGLAAVYGALDLTPQSTGQIAKKLGEVPIMEISSRLMELCMTKHARQVSPGYFQKNVP